LYVYVRSQIIRCHLTRQQLRNYGVCERLIGINWLLGAKYIDMVRGSQLYSANKTAVLTIFPSLIFSVYEARTFLDF